MLDLHVFIDDWRDKGLPELKLFSNSLRKLFHFIRIVLFDL